MVFCSAGALIHLSLMNLLSPGHNHNHKGSGSFALEAGALDTELSRYPAKLVRPLKSTSKQQKNPHYMHWRLD